MLTHFVGITRRSKRPTSAPSGRRTINPVAQSVACAMMYFSYVLNGSDVEPPEPEFEGELEFDPPAPAEGLTGFKDAVEPLRLRVSVPRSVCWMSIAALSDVPG
jgi:hypothetical protein